MSTTLTAHPFQLDSSTPVHDDASLVSRFQKGDESAFSQIVAAHRHRIYGYVRNMLRNETDAEEVTQDTFVRAYRGLSRFRGDASLTTWLHRIATNLARNRYWYFFRRRRQDTISLDYTPADSDEAPLMNTMVSEELDPCQHSTKEEFVGAVRTCIQRIDPAFREALVMRAGQDMSYGEISRRTGVPVGTVKSRIARARRELKQHLAQVLPHDADAGSLQDFFERTRG